MPKSIQKYLYDVKEAIDTIKLMTKDISLDEFSSVDSTRSTVIWRFFIIGEALNQALRIYPGIEEKITGIHQIIGLRNNLAHGYSTISDSILWGIIKDDLLILEKEIDQIFTHKD